MVAILKGQEAVGGCVMPGAFASFDIRNFQDQLEPSKAKNKFICPVCGGNDLSIVPETGKYRCFNNCECKDIREAIKPWAEVVAERAGANYTPSLNRLAAKPKRILPKPAPIPDGELGLVMLTDTVTDIPQPKKLTSKPPKDVEGSATETIYPYSESQWVVRYQWTDANKEKGYSKTFRQWHRRLDGTPQMKKGDLPWGAYRIDEALAAAKSVTGTPALLQHEGEGCVEVGRQHGLAGITFQGSGWDKKTITLEYQRAIEAGIGLIVFLHDPDDTGLKKLQTCSECAAEVGIAFIGISPNSICPDLPYKSSDIKEILGQMETPEFIRRLEQEIHAAVAQRSLDLAESETIEKEVTDLSNFKIDIDPADPEAFYLPVCTAMNLPYSNCVTAGTFDGWAYRKIFPQTEWMVLNSSFYKWSQENNQWQHQDDNKAYKLLADAGEDAYKLSYTKTFGWRITKPYETNAHKESAFKYCRSRLEPAEPLPTNTHLLGFNNCVVDLRTGEQMPHRKDFYLTNIIPHDYEANKPCPEVFLKFLNESFGSELVEVIRAFTSMFLDPTAPYGRFPHLIGLSGGGKGTLGRFWSSLFGESGSSSATHFADISTPEGRHQYLSGKRIFGFPDVGGYAEGVRAFYELVDNGPMSGRALFNPVAYSIQWYIRFWIASVSHLQIENAGDGWMRRAYPIPVKNRDITPDPDLWLKLQEVKSDIISWALAMPRAERDRILLSPPSSDRAKNLALEASLYGDSTKSFVDLCLRPSSSATFIPQSRLHSWYVLYCREHGYAPLGMSKFISHLKTVLPHNFKERSWTPTVNGKRERIQSHFAFIEPLAGVFEMKVPEGPPDSSLSSSEFWYCFKDKCLEGGIEEFEEFFHPTKTPEPLHSLPVHPVHPLNTPTFDPGQAETLTQLGCPPCPIVLPQELALQKKDEENSESGVNQFVNLTDNPSVPLDFGDNLDSLAVTGFEAVQEVNLAENGVDSLDSPAVTGFSPRQDGELINTRESELSRPSVKVGDKVEFFNDSVHKWQVGIIKSVQLMSSYFCSATIEYRGNKCKVCSIEIFRSDWIKFLHHLR
ncbi:primase-like DNA-binding domain-containing protein [Nostoc sp. 'Peltigera membranacea cyanobiont' N6]|uniref:primase-like DNA-binding domain-containing protein n=1 Tax=Nostoc sp. 'Peltigera membranacea cyanobiont' N6 TaxID=1261031 RepID=UPI000CF30D45|nr:primase-like DNA-binding domain-containing protein [Nostoc sp. 'Peltigera membranacea cyanobiont' N6]AVH68519.1 DNA primase [Nostoc sp. 'Peltigera membranacea cyanobiont' N6]